MRLVPASYKREVFAVAVVAALGLVACLLASGAPEADARPAQPPTAVIPNGTYGVNKAARGEYIVFTVRNRRVRDLEFQIQVSCQASDSPTSEQRFFSAGARAPQGHLVSSNGKLALSWEERGEGRLGEIDVGLKFGARDVANIGVVVPEEEGPESAPEEAKEHCDGGSALSFRRGFELPPMPLTP
ncbi:MAG TPA: hypothetical protein VGO24_04985 [Solirubrobacterales bacterium]|jgi:hypothetical protein|nr:hypothetical protein [Solirubrobacterales bacterium]